jgi:hypothetical protein
MDRRPLRHQLSPSLIFRRVVRGNSKERHLRLPVLLDHFRACPQTSSEPGSMLGLLPAPDHVRGDAGGHVHPVAIEPLEVFDEGPPNLTGACIGSVRSLLSPDRGGRRRNLPPSTRSTSSSGMLGADRSRAAPAGKCDVATWHEPSVDCSRERCQALGRHLRDTFAGGCELV